MKTKTNFLNIISKTTLFLLVAVFVISLSSYILSTKIKAVGPNIYLGGFIYSENIGWIEFQPGHGGSIYMDDTGNIFGYAWSENIGWVKFGGLTDFPTGPGTTASNAKKVGSNIVGWVRVCGGMDDISENQSVPNNTCTGTTRTDGWDGWISLGGNTTGGQTYGVTINSIDNTLSGWAWGSDVLGWIDFSPTISNSISVIDFYTFPTTIYAGQEAKITWKTSGANSCTITKDDQSWGPGSTNATSGTNVSSGVINSLGTVTFKLSCTNTLSNIGPISKTISVLLRPKFLTVDPYGKIIWDAGDGANSCNVVVTSSGGTIISTTPVSPVSDPNAYPNSTPTNGIVMTDLSVGDIVSLSCASPFTPPTPVTISDSGVSGSSGDCSVTQPIDAKHPDANILYKDRKTTFAFTNSSPTGVTWKVNNVAISGNTNVFTTIGTKTITGTGLVAGTPVSCTKTVNIKLDPGIGSGEQ